MSGTSSPRAWHSSIRLNRQRLAPIPASGSTVTVTLHHRGRQGHGGRGRWGADGPHSRPHRGLVDPYADWSPTALVRDVDTKTEASLVLPTPAGIQAGVLGQKPIYPHSGEECSDSGAEDVPLPRHGVPRGLAAQPSGRSQSIHCCPHACMVSGPGSKFSSVTVKRMASPWRRWK